MFVQKLWHNRPNLTTPANAAGLNDLEQRIADAFDSAGGTPVVRTVDSAARNSGNTGATLTDDAVLTFDVDTADADILTVEGFLIISSANTTMDFQFGWTVPSGVTGYHGPIGEASNLGGWASVLAGSTPAPLKTLDQPYSIGTYAGITGASIAARLFVGGTGTVTLQWAQNTSDAGDLILAAGSELRISKVA